LIAVAQTKPGPELGLVNHDTVQIYIGAQLPALVIVQIDVAGDRLGIGWRGIEHVRQDFTGAVKRIGVSVRAPGEKNTYTGCSPLMF